LTYLIAGNMLKDREEEGEEEVFTVRSATIEKKMTFDEEGYLTNFDDWNEKVAKEMALREGVGELSPDKLESLRFIRDHYSKFNFFPILRSVCKNVGKPKDCVEEDFLNPLIAWKLAGLPHPEEPVISLLKSGQSPG
jgi:TusE/DsrC/DsvC family sulfur relay protein